MTEKKTMKPFLVNQNIQASYLFTGRASKGGKINNQNYQWPPRSKVSPIYQSIAYRSPRQQSQNLIRRQNYQVATNNIT